MKAGSTHASAAIAAVARALPDSAGAPAVWRQTMVLVEVEYSSRSLYGLQPSPEVRLRDWRCSHARLGRLVARAARPHARLLDLAEAGSDRLQRRFVRP